MGKSDGEELVNGGEQERRHNVRRSWEGSSLVALTILVVV